MGMDTHTKADHHYRRRGTKENDADNSATDGLSNELAQGTGGGLLYVEGISIDYLGTSLFCCVRINPRKCTSRWMVIGVEEIIFLHLPQT